MIECTTIVEISNKKITKEITFEVGEINPIINFDCVDDITQELIEVINERR